MEQPAPTNRLLLSGRLQGQVAFSHAVNDTALFQFTLAVKRKSGAVDLLPVTSTAFSGMESCAAGAALSIEGQLRAYRHVQADGSCRVLLTAFAKRVRPAEAQPDRNEAAFIGRLVRRPVYRQTPSGREIADLTVSVPHAFGRTHFLPVIAWGGCARFAALQEAGTVIAVTGRFQSRDYQKRLSDDTLVLRTAYEISAQTVELVLQQEN